MVGLALPRSADLVVAMLGILRSGAAYLPIDPRYPSRRPAHLLADAGPDLVLTDTATADVLPETGVAHCLLDEPDPGGPAVADDVRIAAARLAGLAYVMDTSGSTGRPKGVAITHANVVNGVTRLASVVGMRPGARMFAGTSVNFDVVVFAGEGLPAPLVRQVRAAIPGRARRQRVQADGKLLRDDVLRPG